MKFHPLLFCFLALLPIAAFGQRQKKSEEAFVREKPRLGVALPSVVVYDLQGNEVQTSSLRGHYTVLTFGCLT